MKAVLKIFTLALFLFCIKAEAQNWTLQNPKPVAGSYKWMKFSSVNNGFAIPTIGNKYAITQNGGAFWASKSLPWPVSGYINGASMPSNQVGYLINFSQNVVKTTNAGQTWVNTGWGQTQSLSHISFFNEQIGYAVGQYASSGIYKTTNGGASWALSGVLQHGVFPYAQLYAFGPNEIWIYNNLSSFGGSIVK